MKAGPALEVLLLTDAPPDQRPILSFLLGIGARVDTTNTSRAASELVSDGAYDLVVIRRIGAPGDLPDIVRAIKRANPAPRLVCLCASEAIGGLAPTDVFLPEPLNMERFEGIAHSLIGRLALERRI